MVLGINKPNRLYKHCLLRLFSMYGFSTRCRGNIPAIKQKPSNKQLVIIQMKVNLTTKILLATEGTLATEGYLITKDIDTQLNPIYCKHY